MIKATIFDLDDPLHNSTILSTHARLSAICAMIDLGLKVSLEVSLQVLNKNIKKFRSNARFI